MTNLSFTLSLYIAKRFFWAITITLLGLIAVSLLIDTIELLRRSSGKEVPFYIVGQMAVLKAPGMMEKLLPFSVLIGCLFALTRLTRSQELVIVRASGVSAWQFLLPAFGVVMLMSVFMVMVFNPISSAMLLHYEKVEGKYLRGRASLLSVSTSGLWLRQIENENADISEYFINALRVSQKDMMFYDVVLFAFDKDYAFTERLDATQAKLEPGQLILSDVTLSKPGFAPEQIAIYGLPTSLRLEQIQDSFASPETISFWALPGFIQVLEEAGFSALKHKLYWHSLLAKPLLFVGMVLIAAIFSLRMPRRGKLGILIVSGLGSGFMLYFFTDIIGALGMAGNIPIVLAAWSPALIVLMLGTGTLLHLEDG